MEAPAIMKVVSKSIPGRRPQNEDAAFCWSGDVGEVPCAMIAVADGMGGHRGGEEASRLAVEAIEGGWRELLTDREEAPPGADRSWLRKVVREATEAVRDWQEGKEELAEMGTTLTLACACGGEALFANVGDSRTYLVTEREILQVTEDHSAVAKSLREGKITEGEARDFPYQDALTRSIGGGGPRPEPDIFPPSGESKWNGYPVTGGKIVLPERCIVLSCSDGLTKELTDIEIYECLRHTSSLEEGARQLLLRAYQEGSADNVTVAALERGHVLRLEPSLSGGPLPVEAMSLEEATSPENTSGPERQSGAFRPNGSSGAGGRRESQTVRMLLVGLAALLLILVAAYVWRAFDLSAWIPEALGLTAALLVPGSTESRRVSLHAGASVSGPSSSADS
jgi:protein phosphatase